MAQNSESKELEARRFARMAKFFLALVLAALTSLIGAFVFAVVVRSLAPA
jgi:hypothetical protein